MKFTLSRPPPRSKDLNALFLHHDPAARLPAIDYCGALAFSTMEGRLQYLFAPYVEYASDGTVSRILGNLSNDTTDLRPASLSHYALGWMPNVMKKIRHPRFCTHGSFAPRLEAPSDHHLVTAQRLQI